jgi:hypothetical protein
MLREESVRAEVGQQLNLHLRRELMLLAGLRQDCQQLQMLFLRLALMQAGSIL